jgi:anti-sigma factor RsiW
MEHIGDIELIELVAGRLDAMRENTILVHLEGCPRCCAKLAEIRETWDILGAWEVRPRRQVDAERICALAAQAGAPAPVSKTVRLFAPSTLLRLAASIVVAALVGYAAGHWSLGSAQAPVPSQSPSYLSALGLEVGESLSLLVLDDQVAGEGS